MDCRREKGVPDSTGGAHEAGLGGAAGAGPVSFQTSPVPQAALATGRCGLSLPGLPPKRLSRVFTRQASAESRSPPGAVSGVQKHACWEATWEPGKKAHTEITSHITSRCFLFVYEKLSRP